MVLKQKGIKTHKNLIGYFNKSAYLNVFIDIY